MTIYQNSNQCSLREYFPLQSFLSIKPQRTMMAVPLVVALLPVLVLSAAITPVLKVDGFPPDNGAFDWDGMVSFSLLTWYGCLAYTV